MNSILQDPTYIDSIQGKAKNDLINEILEKASIYLRGSQLMDLNRILNDCFEGYEIFVDNKRNYDENYAETNRTILYKFLSTKKMEGLSPRTITYYKQQVEKLIDWADRPLSDLSADNIREFLTYYQSLNDCSNVSLDNVRRIFSSFFGFCNDEGYILKNPMRRVKKIKSTKKIKKAFTDLEIEAMREELSKMPERTAYHRIVKARDRALFELLLSSGIRISECVGLDWDVFDFDSNSFKVTGKGDKERICYFNAKTKFHLITLRDIKTKKKYQHHDNPAVFINYKTGGRIGSNGIERKIRELGQKVDVEAYPHKFRRTFATNLIRKEVPIEQVREMMGHSNLDTTMIYTVIDQEQVKINHNKYS